MSTVTMAYKGQVINNIRNYLKTTKGFEQILRKMRVISAENGECVAEIKVEDEALNIMKTMHGGFASSLVDCISSYALYSDPKSGMTEGTVAVSADMRISYLKAAKKNDELLILGKAVHIGKKMAISSCEIKDAKTGELIINGLHTLYLMR